MASNRDSTCSKQTWRGWEWSGSAIAITINPLGPTSLRTDLASELCFSAFRLQAPWFQGQICFSSLYSFHIICTCLIFIQNNLSNILFVVNSSASGSEPRFWNKIVWLPDGECWLVTYYVYHVGQVNFSMLQFPRLRNARNKIPLIVKLWGLNGITCVKLLTWL